MDFPKKGVYRHFKGKRYELLDFARHSETQEWMVVYRALYGDNGLWVRPLSMWSETVERDGRSFTRFVPEEAFLQAQQDEGFDQMIPPPEMEPPADVADAQDASPDDVKEDTQDVPTGDKHALLKQVYGYDSFREGQEEVIDAILSGRDTLAILPTGAGKSICYQLPAQMLRGVALVISPLISLMKDQVESLCQAGVPAAYLNSSLNERQFEAALRRMTQGLYRIVYVAPERLLTQRFLNAVSQIEISMVAVDEAHCISQWGQDFRPSYLEIPQFLDKLPVRPKLCAFTATATERVREDVKHLLEMRDPFVRVTGFNRPNLYLSVCYTYEKDKKLMDLIQFYRGFSGIVYCGTRKAVEAVCEKLLSAGYPATRYHAGLSEVERRHNQDDFIYDRSLIMVATNAFGMGIDKSNVRFVIHYNMPKDLESYYQEAGRAGRDGERADCHLLFEPRDVSLQNFFIDKMGEEGELDPSALAVVQDRARSRLRTMTEYCRTTQCLRRSILRYFGEDAPENCGYCVNCLSPQALTDVTDAARMIASCVRDCRERFGAQMIIDVLRGANTERIRSLRLDDSSYHGALKGVSGTNLRFIIDAMVDAEILGVTGGDYPTLFCDQCAEELQTGQRRVFARQEAGRAPTAVAKSSANKLPESVDPKLFEELRALRMQIARARSVPPYVICNDSTLVDMCIRRPTQIEDMRFIRGMGDRKIQSIGARFARAIAQYAAREAQED